MPRPMAPCAMQRIGRPLWSGYSFQPETHEDVKVENLEAEVEKLENLEAENLEAEDPQAGSETRTWP
jgi:hypothetical protein